MFSSGAQEHEIQFVHARRANIAKSVSCTTSARSHVMKQYHRQKRLIAGQTKANFRHVTAEQILGQRANRSSNNERDVPHHPRNAIGLGTLDPFDCFAADTSELPLLLENRKFAPLGNTTIHLCTFFA